MWRRYPGRPSKKTPPGRRRPHFITIRRLRRRLLSFRGGAAQREIPSCSRTCVAHATRDDRWNLLLVFVVAAGALVFLRLVVERLVRDAEDFGGLAAIAVGHVESLFDDDALDLFHRLSEWDADGV